MNRRNNGFTLIELLIVLAIFGIVLAGTSQMVVSMLTANLQQSKITESNIEGIIGLEQLRQDLGKAGYGLPWNGLTAYNEVAAGVDPPAPGLNDALHIPKGIMSSNGGGLNGADYLVIRAANVATNAACSKWTFLTPANSHTTWTSAGAPSANDNFANNDWVIILTPGSPSSENTARTLVGSAQFGSTGTLATSMTSTAIVYGIDSNSPTLAALRMPFNRTDYYVKQPATGKPQRCAAETGILYKGVVNQSDGNLTEMPLLDCVADMQVVFRWDQFSNGNLQAINDISGLDTQAIRDQVKEARVYILAHEGQRDVNYNYTYASANGCAANYIYVGGDATVGYGSGRCFNLSGITNWQNYRWKVYTLVVKLDNLL